MNEYNNESNRGPVTPYKASGNLNTSIGNPQVNINDTMNINIQNMATNSVPVANPQTTNIVENPQYQNTGANINIPQSYQNVQNTQNIEVTNDREPSVPINNIDPPRVEIPKSEPTPVYTNQNINSEVVNNQNNAEVQRTYVTMDNKPKKKTLSLSLGPEFKIGLLIIVILLVFVLFLPMISDFLNGY